MIRPATEADLEQVLRVERALPTAPHWAYADYARMLEGDGVNRALLVAAEGGLLNGFAVGKVIGAEAELESVAVAELAQRQGLGRTLCGAVMEWAQQQGAEVMELEVRAASQGAVRLYEGLGFVEQGRRPRYYAEPADDAVLMRCSLEQKTKPEPAV